MPRDFAVCEISRPVRAISSKTLPAVLRSAKAHGRWAPLLLGSVVALAACKPKEGETCKPEEKTFANVRVFVQASDDINLDIEGNAQTTTVRLYQLSGGRSLDLPLEFRQVWQSDEEAFGDELLKKEELTIYPDKGELFEIVPEEGATHFVAAAIFREPVGSSWYVEWEVPEFHGYSVCAAEKKKQTYEDPCLLISMEGSFVDGGHKAPPGIDVEAIPIACPPPPLKVKPAEPTKEKKKKKKGKLKDKLGDAQDKAGEGQDAAAEGQGAGDQAQGAGEAASNPPVPGKD